MKVAIFEPVGDGHYLAMGVRTVAAEMLRRGWRVSLWTGQKSREQDGVRVLQAEFGDALPVAYMPDMDYTHKALVVDRWGKSRQVARLYRDAFRATPDRPDVVFLPALDRLDFATAMGRYPFGRTPVTGIWNGHPFHFGHMGVPAQSYRFAPILERAFRRAIRHPSYGPFLVHDPVLAEWVAQRGVPGAGKVIYAPDFAVLKGGWSREDARASLSIPEDVRVVMIFGMLGGRKGIAEVVRAVAHPSVPTNVWLLAAGKQRGETAEVLSTGPGAQLRQQGRLIEIPGFLDDDAEAKVFAASDVAWLGYRWFDNSSGVLFQAARSGLPVLGCANGLIGWFTRKYEIGLAVDPADTEATASALVRLTSDEDYVAACAANGRRHAEAHLPEKLANTACDACERAVKDAR